MHDIAHQPDEHQIDRIAQSVAHRHHLAIVLALEIVEVVQPAAGKKSFRGAGGIAPLQRRIQQGAQALVFRRKKVVDRPARQDVFPVDFQRAQLGVVQHRQPLMQLGHDVEVAHQRAQFGR